MCNVSHILGIWACVEACASDHTPHITKTEFYLKLYLKKATLLAATLASMGQVLTNPDTLT